MKIEASHQNDRADQADDGDEQDCQSKSDSYSISPS